MDCKINSSFSKQDLSLAHGGKKIIVGGCSNKHTVAARILSLAAAANKGLISLHAQNIIILKRGPNFARLVWVSYIITILKWIQCIRLTGQTHKLVCFYRLFSASSTHKIRLQLDVMIKQRYNFSYSRHLQML